MGLPPSVVHCIHDSVVQEPLEHGSQLDSQSTDSYLLCIKMDFLVIHKVGKIVNFVLLRSEGYINSKSLPPVELEHQYLRIFIPIPIHLC